MSGHSVMKPQPGRAEPRSDGLLIQRKCACGNHEKGGECAACKQKRRLLQRRDRSRTDPIVSGVRSTQAELRGRAGAGAPAGTADLLGVPIRSSGVQPDTGNPPALRPTPTPASQETAEPDAERADNAPGEEQAAADQATTGDSGVLIADDDVADLLPGQLRKSDFLDRLQVAVCTEADAALASVGRSTDGCPYLSRWFDYYRSRSASQVAGALSRYAPETLNVRTAAECVPIAAARVRHGVELWAHTGEIAGVPDDVALDTSAAAAGPDGAGGPFFKARDGGPRPADDPAAVQQELGGGRPLSTGVRSRMERAFGQSFAHVRAHTDGTASRLSSEQNARAFTVGEHVAFGAGEYKPGTMVGDALLAHELAHVVQQRGGGSVARMGRDSAGYNALEDDADRVATGAVASLWAGAGRADLVHQAIPRLRAGLQLQRCKKETCSEGTKSITVDFVRLDGSTGSPATGLTEANTVYNKCCVQFTQGQSPAKEPKADTETWLGGDTDLDASGITCSTATTEESAMYDGATAKHSLASRMRVFYVQTFSGYAAAGFSRPPYCAGGYANHVVLQNTATGATNALAHEFGHILLNSGDHETAPNLMAESGGTDLTDDQCKTIYNNA